MSMLVRLEDHRREDGSIDWQTYRAAQVNAGERCTRCGAHRISVFGNNVMGPCGPCAALEARTEEVDHACYVRCPKCGESWDLSEHDDYEVYADGEHKLQCAACNHTFEITHVSFSFTSPAREK